MGFKQFYLDEQFKDTFEIKPSFSPKTVPVDVFVDPSRKEILELKKVSGRKTVRLGIVDASPPIIYAWRTDVLHDDMLGKLKFDIPILWLPDEEIQFQIFEKKLFPTWKQIKNKKLILSKLQKLSPTAKDILIDLNTIHRPNEILIDLKSGKKIDREESGR